MRKRVGKYFQKMFKNDILTARDTKKQCFLAQKPIIFENHGFSSENIQFFRAKNMFFLPKMWCFLIKKQSHNHFYKNNPNDNTENNTVYYKKKTQNEDDEIIEYEET